MKATAQGRRWKLAAVSSGLERVVKFREALFTPYARSLDVGCGEISAPLSSPPVNNFG
jgi:hypothetical protein